MKQVLHSLRTGATEVAEVPVPEPKPGEALIQTSRSLISSGTERMLIEFGKANLLQKARQQPDKVRQVLEKVRAEGLLPTLETVSQRLDEPLPLGYCNVGRVVEIGQGVMGFSVGDRVASNGPHAEYVCVPENLCAKIPDNVSDEEAAFTVVGAIALQGIRLAEPTLGECFVVSGLGLIGLIAIQLLTANGCRVLGMDLDSGRCVLASRFAAEAVDLGRGEDPISAAQSFSRGWGVDGVLITAATKSSEPVHQAAQICRKRGRIVLVGVTGLRLSREDFYKKELSFQVSCSYGPGRYDPAYEVKGQDYPAAYVRWTAQRNFQAVLDMMDAGRIQVEPLVSRRFAIEEAEQAYAVLEQERASLGIILEYGRGAATGIPDASLQSEERPQRALSLKADQAVSTRDSAKAAVVGFIGAGNYAARVLVPEFQRAGARLKTIVSNGGVSAAYLGRKYGFEAASTDPDSVFDDPRINAVVIATRHNSHSDLVCRALMAGKHVFVEKPLCICESELKRIVETYNQTNQINQANRSNQILMVGFNRRFAPHVRKLKELLDAVREPKAFVMTINAGAIPADHWTQDPEIGGGRIVGEACHFVDLLRYLAGASIIEARRLDMSSKTGDTATLTLRFADGSIGTVHYFANGSRIFPKERLEVFASGGVLQLDNFRAMRGFGWPGFKRMRLWRQDKGQRASIAAFLKALDRGEALIPFEELVEVHRAVIDLAR